VDQKKKTGTRRIDPEAVRWDNCRFILRLPGAVAFPNGPGVRGGTCFDTPFSPHVGRADIVTAEKSPATRAGWDFPSLFAHQFGGEWRDGHFRRGRGPGPNVSGYGFTVSFIRLGFPPPRGTAGFEAGGKEFTCFARNGGSFVTSFVRLLGNRTPHYCDGGMVRKKRGRQLGGGFPPPPPKSWFAKAKNLFQ